MMMNCSFFILPFIYIHQTSSLIWHDHSAVPIYDTFSGVFVFCRYLYQEKGEVKNTLLF